jgi:Putative collagen-binding domain of a collagenase
VEYYFGYDYDNNDLSCQDYGSRANMWAQSRYALEFFSKYAVPFQDMSNANSRVSNGNWCLIANSTGKTVVVYLHNGGTATIDLTGLGSNPPASVSVQWYDPRNGGSLQTGSVASLQLGTIQPLGNAPNNSSQDWVVLLRW